MVMLAVPLTVSAPVSVTAAESVMALLTVIVDAVATVMGLAKVPVPVLLIMHPIAPAPVPLIDVEVFAATAMPPKSNVAPDVILRLPVVPPSPDTLPALTMPDAMVQAPVKVLAPERVRVFVAVAAVMENAVVPARTVLIVVALALLLMAGVVPASVSTSGLPARVYPVVLKVSALAVIAVPSVTVP